MNWTVTIDARIVITVHNRRKTYTAMNAAVRKLRLTLAPGDRASIRGIRAVRVGRR